jgi:hypothetical protein
MDAETTARYSASDIHIAVRQQATERQTSAEQRLFRYPGDLRNVRQRLGRNVANKAVAEWRQVVAAGIVEVNIVGKVHARFRYEGRQRPLHAEKIIATAALYGVRGGEWKGSTHTNDKQGQQENFWKFVHGFVFLDRCKVESRCGAVAVGPACLLPSLSSDGAQVAWP